MKRIVGGLAIVAASVIGLAGQAGAHVQIVDPPGNGGVKVGWVGGPALPGHGQGLVPGGPTGSFLQSPAHEKGLVQACEAIRAHGNGVVDIFGPPTPAGCTHGT